MHGNTMKINHKSYPKETPPGWLENDAYSGESFEYQMYVL